MGVRANRLVNTANLTQNDWLEYRRRGIGGSDIAALCGMSRYKSPMAVYLDKIGELPPIQDNPKMKAGRILEPVIADWFAEETGNKVWKQNAIFQHPDHSFMLANIDRWLPGQNAGLECKNTGEFSRHDWEGTQAPTEYVLQCNWYMAVTGADRWYIAVLIDGWDFQWRIVERDETIITNLITIAEDFWTNNVIALQPPEYSHQDKNLLKERFPTSVSGESCILPDALYDDMQGLYQARADIADAERREETHKNRIKGHMQTAELAYYQDELKFTWKTNKKGVRSFNVCGGEE